MKLKNIAGLLVAMFTLLVACQPEEYGAGDLNLGSAPSAEEMNFTITPGEDEFHFVLENLTPVSGINTIKWDFGNGGSDEGNKVIAYYPLPGEFEIKLTITANDGSSTSKMEAVTQTETDYDFLESPILTMISGGVNATEGKDWVVDSLAWAHFGIGPPDGAGYEWWGATALQKTNSGSYDDVFNFKLVGFEFGFQNNGDSYVKDYQISNPNYSNPVAVDGTDARVDYTPSTTSTWSLIERDGVNYIVLSSDKPAFFGFDYGGNYEYRIDEVTETSIHMSTIGGDGNRWYNKLILKGYEKPVVTATVQTTETAEENTWAVSLTDVNIPEGISVNGFTVDFGDGSEVQTTDDYMSSIEHTYMRRGNFPVTVTVLASNEEVVLTTAINVENYHSAYVPFLLDHMVMYVDNSEIEMAPVVGQDCGVSVVANPERIYPNKGVNVFHYRKENQQWANAYMQLPAGYRFDLTTNSVYKIMVRGKAGQQVLLKLENTDKGGNAWQTGTFDVIYTIQADDTWEIAEFDFAGVGAGFDWTGDQFTSDITTDSRFNQGFYNVVRIMLNPGNGDGTHEFYFDDLAGPHVEGLKSAKL